MIYFKIFSLFLYNEIKIILVKGKNYIIFLREINIYNTLTNILENKKININFSNNYFNRYLDTISKLRKKRKINSDYKIIVEGFINQPEYQINNLIVARKIGDIFNFDINGVLRSGDTKGTYLFKSHGINKIFYLNEGNIVKRFFYLLISIKILNKIKSIKELLKIKYKNLDIGKCLYEQFLRFEKRPNSIQIEGIYYIYLMKLLIDKEQLLNIYNDKKIKFLVQSETQYFPLRTSIQVALFKKIKVISRIGRRYLSVKIYNNIKESYENRSKVSKNVFKEIENKFNKKYKKKNYQKIIEKKIKLNIGKDVYQLIDKKNNPKKLFQDKKQMLNFFNFKNQHTVLILAHEYTDGNLSQSWNLYENDMFWLTDTLRKIKKLKDVNWIIKEHPSEKIYNAKVSTVELFNKIISSEENIKLFPADYRVDNMYKYIDTTITSHGTAGYEYPMQGIPTIICGETNYSSLGFNIEPKTRAQYYKILKNINLLKKLNNEKIQKSWIFHFIYKYLSKDQVDFMPFNTSIKSSYKSNDLWRVYLKYLSKHKKSYNLKNLENSLSYAIKNDKKSLISISRLKREGFF